MKVPLPTDLTIKRAENGFQIHSDKEIFEVKILPSGRLDLIVNFNQEEGSLSFQPLPRPNRT